MPLTQTGRNLWKMEKTELGDKNNILLSVKCYHSTFIMLLNRNSTAKDVLIIQFILSQEIALNLKYPHFTDTSKLHAFFVSLTKLGILFGLCLLSISAHEI